MNSVNGKKSQKPGIYIHVPFCVKKCGYCDFFSVTSLNQKSDFLSALLKEIKLVREQFNPPEEFDTIYFGGGTPSLLTPDELSKILETLNDHFKISADCEITLETNPGAAEKEKVSHFRQIGINRISIGIQSFIDRELRLLERIHTADQARQTFNAARDAGFENIGIDLIYALPGQTKEDWLYSLGQGVSLQPEHISAYNLIFEEGTPFYLQKQKGKFKAKSEDEELEFFLLTTEFLSRHGYIPYEVSNYARSPQFFSAHNYKYWLHVPYLGFGPSAHSFWGNRRQANVRSLQSYLKRIRNNEIPVDFVEPLTDKIREFEHIFLRLRTYEGLDIPYFEKIFKRSFMESYRKTIDLLVLKEYAIVEKKYFRLTGKGMAVCDEILQLFA
ncbi:MAG: radical SAM family heme chaperone HemW [Calditrichaeota bacterium]|nr:radical SAM family heme chaperone HemW [Calditrichota bacterium]